MKFKIKTFVVKEQKDVNVTSTISIASTLIHKAYLNDLYQDYIKLF